MSEWSTCPACAHRFRLGQTFCEGCGRKILYTPRQKARFQQLESERTARKQKAERNGGVHMLCLHCGAHSPKGSFACHACGQRGLLGPFVTDHESIEV